MTQGKTAILSPKLITITVQQDKTTLWKILYTAPTEYILLYVVLFSNLDNITQKCMLITVTRSISVINRTCAELHFALSFLFPEHKELTIIS